jgi:colicin import membrane protein
LSNEKSQDPSKNKLGLTAAEAAELAEAAAKAAAAKAAAAKAAAEVEAEKEYEAAAEEAVSAEAGQTFTNKRGQEQIFRREMGEPEFFRYKKDLVPTTPILTEDDIKEISKRVEIPTDQIPPYKPEHILSPELGGISNYEAGISDLREETEQKLERLRNDPDATIQEIQRAEEDLKTLDYLYQNYYIGMNVFRTAKGGRDKLRE